jgi:TfoX/Sxy family transcriptional regulator of competence genes
MAYDEALARRIRQAVGPRASVGEKKMFGGVAFLLDGKMFCGIASDDLMVRVGPEGQAAALARPRVRPMDFTGRPMKGYVFVASAGTRTARQVAAWVERGLAFAATVQRAPRPKRAARPKRTARPKQAKRPKRGPASPRAR